MKETYITDSEREKCRKVADAFAELYEIENILVVDAGRYGFVKLQYYRSPQGFEDAITFTDSRSMFENLWEEWFDTQLFLLAKGTPMAGMGYHEIFRCLPKEKQEELMNRKAESLESKESACTGKVLVYENGVFVTAVKPYDDNVSTSENILFALAVLKALGYDYDESGKALESFGGVKRRNEFVGEIDGARVVFDYAHHPTQIKGILSSQKGKTMVVFQPHTYSRTKAYFDEFCSSLAEAHTLVIMDTYGARESASDGVDSDALAHAISTKFAKQDVYSVFSFDKTLDFVISRAKDHDNVLFLGAGDIYLLKDMLTPFLDKPR